MAKEGLVKSRLTRRQPGHMERWGPLEAVLPMLDLRRVRRPFMLKIQAQLTYVIAFQRVKRTIEKIEQRLNVELEDLLQGSFPSDLRPWRRTKLSFRLDMTSKSPFDVSPAIMHDGPPYHDARYDTGAHRAAKTWAGSTGYW